MFAVDELDISRAVEVESNATAAVVGRREVEENLTVDGHFVPCTLKDLMHGWNFQYFLSSVRTMSQDGLQVTIESGRCVIRSRETTVAADTLMGSLYVPRK